MVEALEVVHVAGQLRDPLHEAAALRGPRGELARRLGIGAHPRSVAIGRGQRCAGGGLGVDAAIVGRERGGQRSDRLGLASGFRDTDRRRVAAGPQMDAVHDDPSQRDAGGIEAIEQPERVPRRLGGRRRGQHEGGVGPGETRLHLVRAFPEAGRHALERHQELGDVLEESDAGHAFDHVQHALGALLEQAETEAPGRERRMQQQLYQPAVEELDQSPRRIEEIECVL